jgi:hypothetical protein
MPHRILVVATAPDPEDELLDGLRRSGDEDVEVLVVAPASDMSFLEWIADQGDAARAEASRRARQASEAIAPAGKVVAAEVGDPNPLTAIEDALRTFPADELVVVTRPDEAATWLEQEVIRAGLERLGLPITRLVDDDLEGSVAAHARAASERQTDRRPLEPVDEVIREIARGRSPWVVLGAVFLAVALVAALVIAIGLIFYFNAG